MKADKLVGKTIESVEYFEDCNMHLFFTDGTCLSVFAKDTDEVDVIYEGEVIQSDDEVETCTLQDQDFALVSEYAEKQHALELEDYDQFNRDNTDPITKITGQTDKL
jgi:hypothetical protein